MSGRLAGKVAIVTGSSSGIGKAISYRFAEEGATVLVAARRVPLLTQVVERIQSLGGVALAVPVDVMDESQVQHLIHTAVERFGRIDILVNNAGVWGGHRIADTPTRDFDRIIATNLRGTFLCCREGFRHMKKQKAGTIINMSSVAGIQAWEGTGTYSASKHGIMALTRSLAEEGRAYGVKASAICPGGVAHDLVDSSQEAIENSKKISPYDVAEAALYLSTLGRHTVVHQVILDRFGADW